MNVAIIEDNPDHLLLLQHALQEAFPGEITTTETSDHFIEGMERLQRSPPDLLLCDLNLPDSSFDETTTALQQLESGVPVVVLTSHYDQEIANRLVACGIQDYLPKTALEPELLKRTCTFAIERQQLSNQLHQAQAEAERANQIKSLFLSTTSHEIRTPISAVIGLSRIGARDHINTPAGAHFQQINEAGEHLLGVINDILDFSKIESGKFVVEQIPLNLTTVVDLVDNIASSIANQQGVSYQRATTQLPEWIEGDPQRIRQILVNLLSNAIKFSPQGQVRLEVEKIEERLQFRVIDSGIGMDAAQLARLFSPYEQAEESTSRRFGGTGLGLSISQNLAQLMGGEITVDSQLGEGSTFTLSLPCNVCPPPMTQEDHTQQAGPPPLTGLQLLVAEDIEFNRIILQDTLTRAGASVTFATNGQEAVEQIMQSTTTDALPFDLILMDVQMPVLDGYLATQQILSQHPDLPIIGLTAHTTAEERDRCIRSGMREIKTGGSGTAHTDHSERTYSTRVIPSSQSNHR